MIKKQTFLMLIVVCTINSMYLKASKDAKISHSPARLYLDEYDIPNNISATHKLNGIPVADLWIEEKVELPNSENIFMIKYKYNGKIAGEMFGKKLYRFSQVKCHEYYIKRKEKPNEESFDSLLFNMQFGECVICNDEDKQTLVLEVEKDLTPETICAQLQDHYRKNPNLKDELEERERQEKDELEEREKQEIKKEALRNVGSAFPWVKYFEQ